jgi:hypothetical protein
MSNTNETRHDSALHRFRSDLVPREIFGKETLSLDQTLELPSATALFNDVTGSTAL